MPDTPSPVLPAAEIRGALERIFASADFDASERNRRFLRHVVEETLAGRADRIKGYSVAMAVFDRDANFDPQLDPIVRIEASRLRRSLDHYYLTGGQADAIRIIIPKGGYVPTFTAGKAADSTIEVPGVSPPVPPADPHALPDGASIVLPPAPPMRGRLGRLHRWLPRHGILILVAIIVALSAVWGLVAFQLPPMGRPRRSGDKARQ